MLTWDEPGLVAFRGAFVGAQCPSILPGDVSSHGPARFQERFWCCWSWSCEVAGAAISGKLLGEVAVANPFRGSGCGSPIKEEGAYSFYTFVLHPTEAAIPSKIQEFDESLQLDLDYHKDVRAALDHCLCSKTDRIFTIDLQEANQLLIQASTNLQLGPLRHLHLYRRCFPPRLVGRAAAVLAGTRRGLVTGSCNLTCSQGTRWPWQNCQACSVACTESFSIKEERVALSTLGHLVCQPVRSALTFQPVENVTVDMCWQGACMPLKGSLQQLLACSRPAARPSSSPF